MNDAADSPADRWMTLVELGQARGISKAAATRLVRRRKWQRQADNQGRVLVPIDALAEADIRQTDHAVVRSDVSAVIASLQATAAAFRKRAEQDRAERAAMGAEIARLRQELARAEAQEADRQRERADRG